MTRPHLNREDGWQVVFPSRGRNAMFVAWGLGWSGWRNSQRLKHGWEYWNPHLHIGRLFMNTQPSWSFYKTGLILFPARLVGLWRMRRRSYREAMREEPIAVEVVDKGWR